MPCASNAPGVVRIVAARSRAKAPPREPELPQVPPRATAPRPAPPGGRGRRDAPRTRPRTRPNAHRTTQAPRRGAPHAQRWRRAGTPCQNRATPNAGGNPHRCRATPTHTAPTTFAVIVTSTTRHVLDRNRLAPSPSGYAPPASSSDAGSALQAHLKAVRAIDTAPTVEAAESQFESFAPESEDTCPAVIRSRHRVWEDFVLAEPGHACDRHRGVVVEAGASRFAHDRTSRTSRTVPVLLREQGLDDAVVGIVTAIGPRGHCAAGSCSRCRRRRSAPRRSRRQRHTGRLRRRPSRR